MKKSHKRERKRSEWELINPFYQWRNKHHLTYAEAALRLNVSRQLFFAWELGNKPGNKYLKQIEEVTGVTLEEWNVWYASKNRIDGSGSSN